MKIEDKNLEIIKRLILDHLPGSEIMLFGSRARDDFHRGSDYDIMIIIPEIISIHQKVNDSCHLTNLLAKMKISADIIIESADDIDIKKNFIGNVVREAFKEGVRL